MLYSIYEQLILAWMAVGIVTFFILLKVTAPYGRHSSSSWGPMISNRLGWILMEVPVMLCLLYFMREASVPLSNYAWVLLALFLCRSLIVIGYYIGLRVGFELVGVGCLYYNAYNI